MNQKCVVTHSLREEVVGGIKVCAWRIQCSPEAHVGGADLQRELTDERDRILGEGRG